MYSTVYYVFIWLLLVRQLAQSAPSQLAVNDLSCGVDLPRTYICTEAKCAPQVSPGKRHWLQDENECAPQIPRCAMNSCTEPYLPALRMRQSTEKKME
jgi:hypothetical protein